MLTAFFTQLSRFPLLLEGILPQCIKIVSSHAPATPIGEPKADNPRRSVTLFNARCLERFVSAISGKPGTHFTSP
jgi:hypothetical protein